MIWMAAGPRVAAGITRIVAVAAAALTCSCLVNERCYADRDCPRSEICSAKGECTFECAVNQDCNQKFGLEYNCELGHCLVAPTCTTCSFPHAEHACVHGDCQLIGCAAGYHDYDGNPSNGCEFPCADGAIDANGNPDDGCECQPANAGIERCNDRDDNCNGQRDEGFDLQTDAQNCGACGATCRVGRHAVSVCSNGECRYSCELGYFDRDTDPANGCESTECAQTVEVCNGRDDNCNCPGDTNADGTVCGPGDEGVDEGFDKTLTTACGPYCVVCSEAHAVPACVEGTCRIGNCDEGYLDLDGKSVNGCEYACVNAGPERCNAVDDDCDGLVDEGDVCHAACPNDMVGIGNAYCIDRYEASRADATTTSQGTDSTRAYSRTGVLPWMVNPMTDEHLRAFAAACGAVGKHLCSRDEWFAACTGTVRSTYVYGSTFNREACNCVDTYCDDYCTAQTLSSCSTAENCGYSYDCYHEAATGSFPTCTNEYGTFDINGNVWEVVTSSVDSRGYEVRGGAFNCASPSQRVTCEFNANWTALYAGFRCCAGQSRE